MVLLSLLFSALIVASPASIQEVDATQPEKELEAARSRLEGLDPSETADEGPWREALGARIALLEELVRTREARTALPSAEVLEERARSATAEFERLSAESPAQEVALADPSEVTSFEQGVAALRAREAELQAALEELAQRVQTQAKQLQGLPTRLLAAEDRAGRGEAGGDELASYRAASTRLEKRVVGESKAYLTEAAPRWQVLRTTLDSELALARLRLARAQAELGLARDAASSLREAAAEQARRASEADARAAALEDDPLESFRLRIQGEISERKARTTELEALLQTLSVQAEKEREALERIGTTRTRLVRRRGLRGVEGDVLLRRILAGSQRSRRLLRQVETPELLERQRRIELEHMEVADRQWELAVESDEIEELRELLLAAGPGRSAEANESFERFVRGPEGLLVALEAQRVALENVELQATDVQDLMRSTDIELTELVSMLERRLLWIRSYGLLDPATAWSQLGELTASMVEARPLERGRAALSTHPWRIAAAVLALLLLLPIRILRRRIDARQDSSPGSASQAAWWSATLALVSALLLPTALWLLAQVAGEIGQPGGPRSVQLFGETLAVFVLVRGLGRLVLSPESRLVRMGLIRADAAHQGLVALGVFTWIGIFLYAPGLAIDSTGRGYDELVRMLEFPWLGGLGLALLIVMATRGAICRHWTRGNPWLASLWRIVFALLIVGVLVILVSYGLGYRAGARQMMTNSMRVTGSMLGLTLLLVMLLRLGERFADSLARQLAGPGAEEDAVTTRAEALRAVVRAFSLVAVLLVAIALQQTWSLGLSVGVFLEQLSVELADGTVITSLDVVYALLWIVGGHLIVANLGRIFESVTPPSARRGHRGTRMAWLTLARYGILLLAYSAGLLTLNFDPKALGWLLTAASVGLGFGLQEIVANFVSGLILLFERPIRVGDVVTVGETGGTVDRITIRSTVVTNWERQTIFIPNKKFVTENLTNWTRTDNVVRRTVRVGVARGSDIEKTLRLLDELVTTQPNVLSQPKHSILVTGFGESTLEITIFAFCAFENGLRVVSELYRRIHERLPAEGIEIPVPQRHVRLEPTERDAAGETSKV